MATKSSSKSKVHPYLILRNWLPPKGQCCFWANKPLPDQEYYNAILADQIKNEKTIVGLEENIQQR